MIGTMLRGRHDVSQVIDAWNDHEGQRTLIKMEYLEGRELYDVYADGSLRGTWDQSTVAATAHQVSVLFSQLFGYANETTSVDLLSC